MSMSSKQCDDLRGLAKSFEEVDSHIADWGGEAKSVASIIYSAADTIECLSEKVRSQNLHPKSADRPTGYQEWLEERLLDCEPDILCDVVSNECGEWCEDNCKGMRQECLKKCYELCKVEVESETD